MIHSVCVNSQVEIEGLTGDIRFNDNGRRQNYSLNVVEMSLDQGFVKVAEWSDETELMPVAAKYMTTYPTDNMERNRTFIATTIVEEPFVMVKKLKFGEHRRDHEEYEGYCKDLAELLAKRLGINRKYTHTRSVKFVKLSHNLMGHTKQKSKERKKKI